MSRLNLLFAFVCVALAGSASAHHSQAGLFDSNRTVEVTGVVKSVSWSNPHGHIVVTVTDDKGTMTDWDAETASISILRNRGADADDGREEGQESDDCSAEDRSTKATRIFKF